MTENSPEPFHRERVKNMVESSRKNAEPGKCRREGKKTLQHGFYYRRVYSDSETADYSMLRKINLKARKVLSHTALNGKLKELENRERIQRKVREHK